MFRFGINYKYIKSNVYSMAYSRLMIVAITIFKLMENFIFIIIISFEIDLELAKTPGYLFNKR